MANTTLTKRRFRCRTWLLLALGGCVALACVADWAGSAKPARAQGLRCFSDEAPAISACIDGRFLEFWTANGGLAVFGYPLTDAAPLSTPDGLYITQYFERARFELHPDNLPPYDVLLGRLGVERLDALGQPWMELAPETPAGGCQFWDQTEHNICGPFLEAWRSNGLTLDDDPQFSETEHVALWGLPVSAPMIEVRPDGVVLMQWFERARFEQQPSGVITFGLLGAEQLAAAAPNEPEPTPAAPDPAPATPEPAPPTPQVSITPPVPSVPFPTEPCNANVPTPVEGLQLWIVDPAPRRPSDAVACVRLIVDGQAVRGAHGMIYRYRGDERRPSIPQSTGGDGTASFIFYIGEEAVGSRIPVEAVVTYRGVTYTAYADFTPQ